MTPARRRQASPRSEGPKTAAADGSEDAPTGDAGGDSAPPAETGQVDTEDRAAAPPSRGQSRWLHPERIWPD